MKIQESAEDYLEAILILSRKHGDYVRSIDIANYLEFSKPSVSVAMKKLRENGYIVMDRSGYIRLEDSGREIAEEMYERHKVMTSWLKHLGVDETVAAKDACRIEHVLSRESFAAIKKHVTDHNELEPFIEE